MTGFTASNSYFFVKKQQVLHRINYSDLKYVHADGNYCYLVTDANKKFAVKISLRHLLTKLPEAGFIRIHKSFVASLKHLDKIDLKERIAQVGDTPIPIGRTFLPDLTKRLSIV